MQRRHRPRHLLARGAVAAIAQTLFVTGLYPLLPHVVRVAQRKAPPWRSALAEWRWALVAAFARPLGWRPLAGADVRGPRPIIVLHGYAMNRADFRRLARRLAAAGLGPVFGFEYWTLGRVDAAAHALAKFVAEVRAATGARDVDLIGHSMGGVVARRYVLRGGGDAQQRVAHLVTLGSPHSGTELSAMAIGHVRRELTPKSAFVAEMAAEPAPAHTKVTAIWSDDDALVPGAAQVPFAGAETIIVSRAGHLGLLASRRVATEIIARLRER